MSQQNLAGKRFTQYVLEEEIGRSKSSVVYRALQPSVNRQVAIKMLSRDLAKRPEFVQRFQREMKLLAGLEQFNIQSIYDVGIEDDVPFIVMRYLSGGSLADVLARQGRLPAEVAVALTDQIAAGLDYAHAQGIVHRDLKPSNILFDGHGNAYLSDFGLSWLLGAGGGTTGTGDMGSPAYMAPEVAAGMRAVTHSVDIYALGVILFEMLTGQLPFNGSNALQMAKMHLNDPAPSPSIYNADLTPDIDAVILGALAKRPEDRFATAGDLAAALADACGAEPGLVTVVGLDGTLSVAGVDTTPLGTQDLGELDQLHQPPVARKANEWMWFTLVATLLGLGILVLGGFLISRNAGSPGPTATIYSPTASPPLGEATVATEAAGQTPTIAPTVPPTERPVSSAPGGGGGKIAYISERSGNPELYILELASNTLTQVTRNTGKNSEPAWSPDGKWLAYISDLGRETPQLFVVDADGQGPTDLTTRDRVEGYPLWIPGSNALAYYVLQGEDRVLRKVDAVQGGDPQDILTLPASYKTLLDWRPDNHVVFYGYSRSGNLAIVDVDTVTGDRTPITVSGNITFLSFSPDRSQVAFTLMQGRQSQLFLADTSCPLLDQCNARRLVTDESSYYTPRFSPDGKSLMVASDRGGNLDLWLVGLDGTVGEKLPGSGLADYDGVWQP